MDITLPAPITDAKTMLNFSTLHKLHYTRNYLISGLLFRTTFLNFMTFHYYNICIAHKFKQAQLPSPNSRLFTAWKKIKTWISQLFRTFEDPWEPYNDDDDENADCDILCSSPSWVCACPRQTRSDCVVCWGSTCTTTRGTSVCPWRITASTTESPLHTDTHSQTGIETDTDTYTHRHTQWDKHTDRYRHTHTQTHTVRQAHRQIQTQWDRQVDTQTHTDTHSETDTETDTDTLRQTHRHIHT